MSIYGSTWSVDADDHTDTCARWNACGCNEPLKHRFVAVHSNQHSHRVYDRRRTCTCNAGPIIYRGSHILPADTDRRGGTFGLAEIPGFITRDGRDDGPEDEDHPWPYLRVTMRADGAPDCQDVVLDRAQAGTLRDYLTDWLQRTEAKP